MNTKAFMFVFMCVLATIGLIMFQDYLEFQLNMEELKLKMMSREPKESKIVQTKFGHKFIMVNDWKPRNNSTKYALFWGYYILKAGWGHGDTKMDQDFLKNLKCPETNCVLTHDEKLLPNIMDFDAVIYNCYNENVTFPELRSPHQLYIMTANESPIRIYRDLEHERNLINLTMTYRLESDILFPYGEVMDKASGQVIAPALNIKWRQPEDDFKDKKLLEIAKNKTTMASWLVSNCYETKSFRNELVKKLQALGVEVQILGSCGNKTLDFYDRKQEAVKAKFYLAFENSLCTDYITEKAFKMHDQHIVPVIYSGVDMNRFMPPKSYIDANSFETAEDLAKHLKFLSNNPQEYIKYFWWKKYYKVRKQYNVVGEQLCKICKKLHETNLYTKNQYYSDIKAWYTKGMCRNATIKF